MGKSVNHKIIHFIFIVIIKPKLFSEIQREKSTVITGNIMKFLPYVRDSTKHFKYMNLFEPHSKQMQYYHYSHFSGEESEEQRG